MMSEVTISTKQEVVAPVSRPYTTLEMLQDALMRGASMELIERLMALNERYEASQARRAFDAAIAAAKAEIQVIKKTRQGNNGKYEDMGAIADAVAPILSRHGLSYRYRTEQSDKITVTCIIAHQDGHSEETALSANADKTGNKNDIQAIGSAVTYLQRYTLKAALGLAAAADDDGQSAEGDGPISDEQVQGLIDLADEVGVDKRRFYKLFKINAFAEIPKSQFARARQMIEAKRQKANA
jgi:hypothetical protein